MCGLSGWFAKTPLDLPLWESAHRLLRHRGPDDAGIVTFLQRSAQHWRTDESHPTIDAAPFAAHRIRATGVLGHYRLAIIAPDPEGHQPFVAPGGRQVLAYNGEVYNYIELRRELDALGWDFRTRTDTEVVLAALIHWGTSALERFNGMWALAFIDLDSERLLLARDRFGIKPLFYRLDSDAIQFASELRSLRALRASSLDESAAAEYLALGRIDHDERTMLADVRQLRPGHYLQYDLSSASGQPECWYRPAAPARQAGTGSATELRSYLQRAVELRLRSDVPVGTLLSGGLDSTTIAALACTLRQRDAPPLQTFSAVYDEEEFSEEPLIRTFAAAWPQISTHFVKLRARDLLARLDDVLEAADGPVRSASVAAQWALYRKIRQESDVVVLLNGQGSDELFAGYTNHLLAYLADCIRDGNLRTARELFRLLRKRGLRGRMIARRTAGLLWRHRLLCKHGVIRRRLRVAGQTLHWRAEEHLLGPTVLDQLLRFNLTCSELPEYLRYDDRMSMAWSLEARLPFLDPAVVDFSLRLPPQQLIGSGGGKQILRQAVADLLPPEIRDNPLKRGFPTPLSRWIRQELANEVRDAISRIDLGLDRKRLERAWNRGDEDPFLWWRILAFVRWRDLPATPPCEANSR